MPLHPRTLSILSCVGVQSGIMFLRLRVGQVDWCVRDPWQCVLLDVTAPDWFAADMASDARCIKRGAERTTWQVALGRPSADRSVFVKRVRETGWRNRLKRLVLGAATEREWRAAIVAEQRGIPVAKPIAVGALNGTNRSIFLSEWVAGALTLPEFWASKVPAETNDRRRTHANAVIDAVARLFATAHAFGVVHRDGHPQNILVRDASPASVEAFFVDLHGAAIRKRRIPRRLAVRSLAQILHAASREMTRVDGIRFLREYVAVRSSLATDPDERKTVRRLARAIRRAAGIHADRLARQRDRRLWQGRRYFSTLKFDHGWTGTFALRLARRRLFPEPNVPDRSEAQWRQWIEPLVHGSSSVPVTSMVVPGAGLKGDGLKLESCVAPNWITRLVWSFRGAPHRRRFERCHRLRHRDIRSELVLGVLEHRRAGLIDQTLIVLADPNPQPYRTPSSGDPDEVVTGSSTKEVTGSCTKE